MEYPVVGMIDSGTAPGDPFISSWGVARDVHVAEEEQDNTHGSLVAGLIVHARRLNHGDDRFPLGSARIVNVVALGKNGTTEGKLISTLEQALEAHPEVKVWNLSLGTEKGVADRAFSDLGVALDRLQDEYRVTFIIAAGNLVERFNRMAAINATAPATTYAPSQTEDERRAMRLMLFQSLLSRTAATRPVQVQVTDCSKNPRCVFTEQSDSIPQKWIFTSQAWRSAAAKLKCRSMNARHTAACWQNSSRFASIFAPAARQRESGPAISPAITSASTPAIALSSLKILPGYFRLRARLRFEPSLRRI